MPIYGGYTVNGLALSERAFEDVCYNNYLRFAGESIKPVDDKLYRDSALEMYNDLKDIPEYEASAEWLKKFI
jgi:hypothetical protein